MGSITITMEPTIVRHSDPELVVRVIASRAERELGGVLVCVGFSLLVYHTNKKDTVSELEELFYNPFPVKQYGTQRSLELYEAHIRSSPLILYSILSLKGTSLACTCRHKRCHGEVVVKVAREVFRNTDPYYESSTEMDGRVRVRMSGMKGTVETRARSVVENSFSFGERIKTLEKGGYMYAEVDILNMYTHVSPS